MKENKEIKEVYLLEKREHGVGSFILKAYINQETAYKEATRLEQESINPRVFYSVQFRPVQLVHE